MSVKVLWKGVYPAATTQFDEALAVDLPATKKVLDNLVVDGVDGLVVLGTCGENNSLEPEEKRAVLKAAVEVVAKRVPIVTGVSELTTERAVKYVQDAEKIGIDALMVLPAMVYVPTEDELFEHFKRIAAATSLPIMIYNNPTGYRVEISLKLLERLAEIPNVVAVKESATDTRRFTDVINAFGSRFTVLAGLDDVALEGLMLGATGWVSGLTSAFPKESVAIIKAMDEGRIEEARAIYRWFMPLLHLDSCHDLVQGIKLAEALMGRGSERVRMPRLPLNGARREQVIAMVKKAAETAPCSGK
jgi:4-hydroxy-tetrahydrodipicolinate synthase